MKSLLTVSGVVFAHICVFLLLVNGCRGTAANDGTWRSDTSVYSGGARAASSPSDGPAQAVPAEAVPAEAVPAQTAPAEAEPAQGAPAAAEPAPAPAKAESAASPAPAETAGTDAKPAPEGTVYYVQKGDALSIIAVRNGLTAKELADANGIELKAVLRVGQKLIIPPAKAKKTESAKPVAVEGEIYVVKNGDVLGTIARAHKTTVAEIMKANNLKNPNSIRVGQKLVIPTKNAPKAEEKAAEPAAAPAQQPTESAPAESAPAESAQPAQSAQSAPAEASGTDENFGMPDGGFTQFGAEQPVTEAPAESAPAEAAPAEAQPAEAGPATGTPSEQ